PIVPCLAAPAGSVDPGAEILHDLVVEAEEAVLEIGEGATEVSAAPLGPRRARPQVDCREAVAGDHLDHRGGNPLPRRIASSARTAHIVLAQLPALGFPWAPATMPPPAPGP